MYVHIPFPQENCLICPIQEKLTFLIASFPEAIRRHIFRIQS